MLDCLTFPRLPKRSGLQRPSRTLLARVFASTLSRECGFAPEPPQISLPQVAKRENAAACMQTRRLQRSENLDQAEIGPCDGRP